MMTGCAATPILVSQAPESSANGYLTLWKTFRTPLRRAPGDERVDGSIAQTSHREAYRVPADILVFSPDGGYLAVTSEDADRVEIWPIDGGDSKFVAKAYGKRYVAFSADGRMLVVPRLGGVYTDEHGWPRRTVEMGVVDTDYETLVRRVNIGSYDPRVVAFHPTEPLLLVGKTALANTPPGSRFKGPRGYRMLSTATWEVLRTARVPPGVTQAGVFSPTGEVFAEAYFDPGTPGVLDGGSAIRIWDGHKMELRNTIEQAHDADIHGLAFANDGRRLVSGGEIGVSPKRAKERGLSDLEMPPHKIIPVKVWDVQTGELVESFSGHERWITTVGVIGDYVLAHEHAPGYIGGARVFVWRFGSEQPVDVLQLPDSPIQGGMAVYTGLGVVALGWKGQVWLYRFNPAAGEGQ